MSYERLMQAQCMKDESENNRRLARYDEAIRLLREAVDRCNELSWGVECSQAIAFLAAEPTKKGSEE